MKAAIFVLFAVVAMTMVARADEIESEDQGDDHWKQHRKMKLVWDDDEIKFESTVENKSASIKDQIQFEVKTDNDEPYRIKYEYKHDTDDTESELDVRVAYTSVVEFAESSKTFNGYDKKDTIVQRMDFAKNSFLDITSPKQTNITGGTKYEFYIRYATVFAMNLSFASATYSSSGLVFTPMQIKIDITLENFPYKRNDTYLAVVCHIQATNEIDHDDDGDNDGNEQDVIEAADTAFALGWNRTVEADGVTADVVATNFKVSSKKRHSVRNDASSSDDDSDLTNEKITYYAFNAKNAKKIVWDPVMGVESKSAASYFTLSLSAVVLSLFAILF